ncbi:ATP-binding protein [Pararhodonellum marinum]|uniref:ATP-binding protein n=1 Tax=Pararhodonellum marinum TaxID=2755358 RepID=UPI00189083E3|nr:ATP-binding protein [Pararhodonellum marinum]
MDAKKKNDLEETYERILNVGFCIVPYEDISDIIGPDPMVYGTAKDERILSFEGVEALFKSQYEQMGNMKPAFDRKRIAKRISNGGNNACIIEEFTLTLSSDEEIHTIFMRATCVMEYLDNQWKLTHWHTSTPVDTENDPWHMEEWKREKEKLQQLVDEQTAALKQNNRELQIEAALEKIRSSSLAMQKTEDLREVVKVLFEQMQGLSVDMGFATVSIFIFEDVSRNIRQWLPLPDGVSSLSVPYFDHPISSDLFDAKESGEDFFTKIYTLEEKNTWLAHGFEHTDYKDLPVAFKSSLLQAPGYAIAITLAKNSGICIPSFEGKLPTPENIQIMKRVGKVFEQAYIRFLDLQKAESQAREAQIEVAVERVRAKALAMHKSTEILQVAMTLKEQMEGLNLSGVTAATIYLEHDDNKIRVWDITELKESEQGPQLSSDFTFRLEDTDPGLWVRRIWNASEKYSVIEMSGDDFIKCEKWIREFDETAADNYREFIRAAKIEHTWHPTVHLEKGKLNLDFTVPPPVEMEFILPKMGAAFDLAYRRFLDLQKAEAQAKEAQIEVSLERVRSASMAMHKTDELGKVVEMLFLQFSELDLDFYQVWINIFRLEEGVSDCWFSPVKGVINEAYTALVPLEPFENLSIKTWKAGEEFSYLSWNGLREVDKVMKELSALTNHPSFHQIQKKKRMKRVEIVDCNHKYGVIAMAKNEDITDNDRSILKRFANVFEQSYTRFLDLQKAESQAREAKIESALERVRSRSLAMHHSSELSAVVDTLLGEFTNLEFTLTFCIINLIDEQDMSNTVWAANPETGKDPESYYMKFEDYPFHHAMWDAWKAQKKRFVYIIEGEEKKIYDEYLYSETEFRRFPKHVQDANKALERYVAGFTFFKYSGLQTVSLNPITEDDLEILERFGKVFEQAYTRFLDLQKVEAQAREAEIQLALERVRARSLAMHRSEELADISLELVKQVQVLGMESWFCAFNIYDDDPRGSVEWGSNGQGTFPTYRTPREGLFLQYFEAGQRGETLLVNEIGEEACPAHYEYLCSLPGVGEQLLQMKAAGIPFPASQIDHVAFFKYGYVLFITYEPAPESHDIFKRFANVFEQSYTRFLDLQKAEAQAREARIEAALERVRSRSMAMHKTDELQEVVRVVAEELKNTGVILDTWGAVICTYFQDSKDVLHWTASEDPCNPSIAFLLPYFKDELFDEAWESKERGDSYFAKVFSFEVKNTFFNHAFEHSDYRQLSEDYKKLILESKNHGIAWAWAKNSAIMIPSIQGDLPSEDEKEILIRFARVFEQSFIRFLDLQKAEAQAREAQIEASLERIRAKAMSMHHSDELDEVLAVLCEQFDTLGIFPMSTHMTVLDIANNKFTFRETGKFGNRSFGEQTVALDAMDTWKEMVESWKSADPYSINRLHFPKETLPQVWEVFHESFASMPEGSKITPDDYPDGIYHTAGKHPFGYIGMNQVRPATEKEEQIVVKFANEFGRAYQRFLDLQKAEEQTREAQINLAVERVRARALAMFKSEEILGVVTKLKNEVMALDIPDVIAATIILKEGEDKVRMWDLSSLDENSYGDEIPFVLSFKFKKRDPNLYVKRVWENPENYFLEVEETKDFKRFIEWLRENNKNVVADEVEEFIESTQINKLHHAVKKLNNGKLVIDLLNPPPDEMETLLTKMGAAFDLAYKRFEDLQKAEAQTRESEIQLALERVRARTMAMHNSDELAEASSLLFQQMEALGVHTYSSGFTIWDEKQGHLVSWMCNADGSMNPPFRMPIEEEKWHEEQYDSWKKGDDFIVKDLNGEEMKSYFQYLRSFPLLDEAFKKSESAGHLMPERQVHHTAHFSHGNLLFITLDPIPDAHDIFTRFAKVFDQTYTRFLDLKKSEAQAKEAKIEVALEKVRSRTMAMQKAEELGEVATVLFREMNALVDNLWTCGFVLCEPNRQEDEWWLSLNNGLIQPFFLPNIGDYAHESLYKGWIKGESYRTVTLQDEVLQEHYDWLMNIPISRKIFEEMEASGISRPNWQRLHAAYFKTGYLVIITEVPCEAEEIFKRFAQVFDLTYTRFLDLQKAENQARESQIEASLERVRAKALAMHNSEDLRQTITAIFEELKGLNIKTIRLGLGLVNPDRPEGEIVTSRIDGKDHILEVSGKFRLEGHPVLDSCYDHFKQQQDYFPILEGEEINSYYAALQGYVNVQGQGTDTKHFGCFLYFKEGCLYAWSAEPHSEGQIGILKKFSRVVEITYRRYKDLLESEYREKEAVKQASLDRVRAEIASMRTANDLERITPLIWKELTTLGIPFLRCGVFIMDEKEELIHTFLSTPDGKAIAAFHLPYTSNPFFNAIEEWRAKKIHISHWDTEEFSALADSLVKEGQLINREQYLNSVPKGGLYLHYVPFLQGIVYVGNTAALTNENLQLVQSVADAFSTAYARYEDFVKLEQAKAKVESAMSELKATQSQLVQQEKLASLGQLTAGIAHEIKNPLNFVNNFSEVSMEMIEEILEARDERRETRVKTFLPDRQDHEMKREEFEEMEDEILEDIKINLKKIHEHGSRANGIVTSMLQHSRGGSGKMEPTDLNALIKEYVNLSFHGMRAGKNPINVEIALDLYPDLGMVSLIKEDFTRVIINLCNNAFDALRSKVQSKNLPGLEAYHPKLTVRTNSEKDHILLQVADNGPGIPDDIKDKILQPFFTTKKGTEGTGLGLSITNDIVKAHGGELEIETVIDKGTKFIIKLNT